MTNKQQKHSTNRITMDLTSGSTDKKAGSNRFSITIDSDDWRLPGQTVRMTVREAQAVKRFLNRHLDS